MIDQQAQALEQETPAPETPDGPEEARVFKADRPEKGEKTKRTRASDTKTIKEAVQAPTAVPAEQAEWEGPKYLDRWKDKAKASAKYLATHPELKQHWEALQGQVDEIYQFNGKTENELGRWRQQMGPVGEMLSPYASNWQRQGMSLQQGLGQLLAYQDALARDPDSTLPELAAMFKPRDAAKVLQALSQAWGADLGQVAQQAPYIDPNVQQMVSPLLSKIQQLEQAQWSQQQAAMQQQQHSVLTQIDAFEQAVDDKGNRKHPFFREMFHHMVALANAQRQLGMQPSIEDIYNQVAATHPATAEWRAKQGAEMALANASRSTDAAKQASDASRNVAGGKATGRPREAQSRLEAMQMADKQLGLTGG